MVLEVGTRLLEFFKYHDKYWLLFATPYARQVDSSILSDSIQEQGELQKVYGQKFYYQMVQKDGFYLFRPGRHPMLLPGYPPMTASINSLGLRGKEVSHEKSRDTYRVVVLGESAVFGTTVNDEETVSCHLEHFLNHGVGESTHVEIINGGMPGATSSTELALFHAVIAPLHPDLIVLYSGFNDHSAKTEQRSSFLYQLSYELHGLLYYKSLFYTLTLEKFSLWFTGRADALWGMRFRVISSPEDVHSVIDRYTANVHALIDSTRPKGIRVLLVTQPLWFSPYASKLSEETQVKRIESTIENRKDISREEYRYFMQSKLMGALHGIANSDTLPLVDAVGTFEGIDPLRRGRLFSDTVHLTPAGNKFLAETIANAILEQQLAKN